MSRHLGAALAAGLLALALTACDGGREVEAAPTPLPVSEECTEAFATAVGVADEEAAEEPDDGSRFTGAGVGAGTLTDLRSTLTACPTTAEWFEAYRAHWTERTEGVPPTTALRALCDRVRDDEARDADVCRQMVADDPEEHPGGE